MLYSFYSMPKIKYLTAMNQKGFAMLHSHRMIVAAQTKKSVCVCVRDLKTSSYINESIPYIVFE